MTTQFSLGQRIRELRLQKHLTQMDLATGICTPSMISQIESDRAKPSYKILALIAERLTVPMERLLMDVDMNLDSISTHKMARALVAGKEYKLAIPLFRELLDTPRSHISTSEVLSELGECLIHTGEWEEAEKHLDEVLDAALLRHDERLQAHVLKNLGQLQFHKKCYPLALFHWHKALEQVEKMKEPDLYLQADILHHLGQAHAKTGHLGDALTLYAQAGQLYESVDNLYAMGHVYMGLGVTYKELDDLEKSVEYSDKAIGIFEGLENIMLTLKNEVTCAVLYGESGREDEAEEMLQHAYRRFLELGNREEAGVALVELGKLRLRQDRLQEAESNCAEARLLLPERHLYQAWVNRVRAQVEVKREQHHEAIRHYLSAADAFKRLEELGEWGETMYELSRLYLDSDMPRAYQILEEVRSQTRQTLSKRGIVL